MTFHRGLLTQPPVSAVSPWHTVNARRRLASPSAPPPPKPHWLCILVMKEGARLDLFQDSKK